MDPDKKLRFGIFSVFIAGYESPNDGLNRTDISFVAGENPLAKALFKSVISLEGRTLEVVTSDRKLGS
jgi:hypothetical protein